MFGKSSSFFSPSPEHLPNPSSDRTMHILLLFFIYLYLSSRVISFSPDSYPDFYCTQFQTFSVKIRFGESTRAGPLVEGLETVLKSWCTLWVITCVYASIDWWVEFQLIRQQIGGLSSISYVNRLVGLVSSHTSIEFGFKINRSVIFQIANNLSYL